MTWEGGEITVYTSTWDEYKFPANTSFAEAVKDVARRKGWGKFRVFVGETEITGPNVAPATLSDADGKITVTPEDKGAV